MNAVIREPNEMRLSERVVEIIERMPAFTPSTFRIIDIANNLDASSNTLVKEIESDPVIAGKIIGLVNSSFFGLTNKVHSLSQCVILLGYNTVKNIALTAVLANIRGKQSSGTKEMMDALWRHMVATGIIARNLAAYCRMPKTFQNFVFNAGLLKCLGEAVLMISHESEYRQMHVTAQKSENSLDMICQLKHGYDTRKIGRLAAETWGLPSDIATIIAGDRTDNAVDPLCHELIELGEHISVCNEIGWISDFRVYDLIEELKVLEIPISVLRSVLEEVDEQTNEMIQILEISSAA